MDIALIYSYIATHFIARRDTAISNAIIIKLVVAHMHSEILILNPFGRRRCRLSINREDDVPAAVLTCQLMPLIDIEISILAFPYYLTTLRTFSHNIHIARFIISGRTYTEVHRCYIYGNRHIDIIWIYLRRFIHFHRIFGSGCTSGKQYRKEYISYVSSEHSVINLNLLISHSCDIVGIRRAG